MRRAAIIGSLFLVVFLAIGAGGILLLEATDIAGPVGRYATHRAGRPLTIASLRVRPGRWLTVELQDLRVANVSGGSTPEMVTIRRATAEVDLLSLVPDQCSCGDWIWMVCGSCSSATPRGLAIGNWATLRQGRRPPPE